MYNSMVMKSAALMLIVSTCLSVLGCSQQDGGFAGGRPLATAAERSSWQSSYATGQAVATGHYRIYTTAKTHALLEYLPGFMEAAYQNYLELTGLSEPTSANRMPIYMLGTRDEWAALTNKVTGPLAEAYLQIEAGGYCFNGACVFWDIGSLQTLSVSSHEGLHQFFHQRLTHRLPAWLEEGLCATTEGYEIRNDVVRFTPERNTSRFNDLRSALTAGWWIGLRDLLPMDAGDVVKHRTEKAVGYYGQLWALVLFIRSRPEYRLGMQRMLADAETGKLHETTDFSPEAFTALLQRGKLYNRAVSEKLFRSYICTDLEGFDREFHEFAERLAGLR